MTKWNAALATAMVMAATLLATGCGDEQLSLTDSVTRENVASPALARVVLEEGKPVTVDARTDGAFSDAPAERVEGLVADDGTVVAVTMSFDDKGARVFELTGRRPGRTHLRAFIDREERSRVLVEVVAPR